MLVAPVRWDVRFVYGTLAESKDVGNAVGRGQRVRNTLATFTPLRKLGQLVGNPLTGNHAQEAGDAVESRRTFVIGTDPVSDAPRGL